MSEEIESINRIIRDLEEKISKTEETASIEETSIKNNIDLEFNDKIGAAKVNLEKEMVWLKEAEEKYNEWKKRFADKKVYVKNLKKTLNSLMKEKSDTLKTKLKPVLDNKERKIKDFQKAIKNLKKKKAKIEKAPEKEKC